MNTVRIVFYQRIEFLAIPIPGNASDESMGIAMTSDFHALIYFKGSL